MSFEKCISKKSEKKLRRALITSYFAKIKKELLGGLIYGQKIKENDIVTMVVAANLLGETNMERRCSKRFRVWFN